MPRGYLSEKHVQRVAVNWLASHFQSWSDAKAIVSEMEVVVDAQTKFGRGRADGLVALQLSDGSVYTAALEAKSARTLRNVSLQYRDGRWVLHALFAGVLGLLLAGLVGWYIDTWFFRWAFPAVAFFGVSVAYLLFTAEHSKYRPIDVIQQVKRYPANESWVGISADAYNMLYPEEQDALHADCRKEGIGLLRVQSAAHVTLLEEPLPRRAPKGYADFLACYARSKVIRQKLRIEAEENNG